MIKKIIFAAVFFMAGVLSAQTINLQTGVTFSSLNLDTPGVIFANGPFFDKKTKGYSLFIGIDYLEYDYFNLSTNIGFIEKGGATFLKNYVPEFAVRHSKINYFSVNTLVDFKYPVTDNISPFVSFGGRLDFLSDYPSELAPYLKDAEDPMPGLLFGGGFRYDLPEFRFEIYYMYYHNLRKTSEFEESPYVLNPASGKGTLDDKTSSLNLSFGFKI